MEKGKETKTAGGGKKKQAKKTVTQESAPAPVIMAEAAPAAEKEVYKVKQALEPGTYVTVKNGFNGTLVYKSKKTGERFIWESFGDEQEIELAELKSARNSYKAFFINNWFLFDDPAVVDWLGVGQYYKHALNAEGFDKLFGKEPKEIREVILGLSEGQKKSVAFRAKQLIAEGKIDSIRTINVLEGMLGVELIER